MAHEIGHKLSRDTNKGSKVAELKDKLVDTFPDEDAGVLAELKEGLKRRSTIINNEKLANKEGKKLLKFLGADKEAMRIYKKSRKMSLDTYKHGENMTLLDRINYKLNKKKK